MALVRGFNYVCQYSTWGMNIYFQLNGTWSFNSYLNHVQFFMQFYTHYIIFQHCDYSIIIIIVTIILENTTMKVQKSIVKHR